MIIFLSQCVEFSSDQLPYDFTFVSRYDAAWLSALEQLHEEYFIPSEAIGSLACLDGGDVAGRHDAA